MFRLFQCIVLFIFILLVCGENCQDCVAKSDIWCVESAQCFGEIFGLSLQALTCNTTINDILNCPMYPQKGYEYSDHFARTYGVPFVAAAYADDPTPCVRNTLPSATVYSNVTVDCSAIGPYFPCHVYTVVDQTNNVIIVSFEGTAGGDLQLLEEGLSYLVPKKPFFDVGNVYDYFYDSFEAIWNGGLENDTKTLHQLYSNYSVWVMGHSLGGAQASIYASYILKTKLYTPEKVRLLTFGQPRTGDRNFAQWHDDTFLYSYRVVHAQDIVPHLPPNFGIDELWHHRFEVWYNNNMTIGQPFAICPESDGPYCSNRYFFKDLSVADHLVYFDVDLGDYASKGCPKL